jgi:hypothetical protein
MKVIFLKILLLKDGKCLSSDGPLVVPLDHVNLFAFIDQSTKTWKTLLIYNLFDVTTAHLILSTPIQPMIPNDKLIWKAKKNGTYSGHSAYRICVIEIADNFHLYVPRRWNLIWNLKVPPKIKNFT